MFGASPAAAGRAHHVPPAVAVRRGEALGALDVTNYREAYGLYAVCGILFNHESPRRGETFLTRKVTQAVAHIEQGLTDRLVLGNLDAVRDWGYATEYVEGMWRMLQPDSPSDYVLATGVGTTVREFVRMSFEYVGLDWQEYVDHDERYERPTEVDALIGDPSRAERELGWRAETKVEGLAQLMVEADLAPRSTLSRSPVAAPALVTGVTGQDGVYLARLLRDRGVPVVGTRQDNELARTRVSAYLSGVEVRVLDLLDPTGFGPLLAEVRPARVFHLAGSTSVAASWQDPAATEAVNDRAVARLLDDVRAQRDRTGDDVRVFVASSAVVGREPEPSPYGRSKAAAEQHVRDARDAGLWTVSARLHNHESPLREPQFVTRKISRAAAAIALGREDSLTLGNTAVRRDWGHARDHVEAMRRMLEQETPVDLELGTGVAHGLLDLVACAFETAGLGDATPYLRTDDTLLRPGDAAEQVADPEPAAKALGWRAGTSFADLVAHLVRTDLERLRTGVEHDPAYL